VFLISPLFLTHGHLLSLAKVVEFRECAQVRPFCSNRVPGDGSDACGKFTALVVRNVRPASGPCAAAVAVNQGDLVVFKRVFMTNQQAVILARGARDRPDGLNIACELVARDIPHR